MFYGTGGGGGGGDEIKAWALQVLHPNLKVLSQGRSFELSGVLVGIFWRASHPPCLRFAVEIL
jgi:hypothetical protein